VAGAASCAQAEPEMAAINDATAKALHIEVRMDISVLQNSLAEKVRVQIGILQQR
jgi:hypothetical protein